MDDDKPPFPAPIPTVAEEIHLRVRESAQRLQESLALGDPPAGPPVDFITPGDLSTLSSVEDEEGVEAPARTRLVLALIDFDGTLTDRAHRAGVKKTTHAQRRLDSVNTLVIEHLRTWVQQQRQDGMEPHAVLLTNRPPSSFHPTLRFLRRETSIENDFASLRFSFRSNESPTVKEKVRRIITFANEHVAHRMHYDNSRSVFLPYRRVAVFEDDTKVLKRLNKVLYRGRILPDVEVHCVHYEAGAPCTILPRPAHPGVAHDREYLSDMDLHR